MIGAIMLASSMYGTDPYTIFDRARARWASQSYARYLKYDVVISAGGDTNRITNTYASFADTSDGSIRVRATSFEESAHPPVPHGVNVNTKLAISWYRHPQLFTSPQADGGGDIHVSKTIRVSKREQHDVLGVPMLSPSYSFGMAPNIAPLAATTPPPTVSQMKTIAAVTAVRRDYDVRFDGTQPIDGAPCYVLDLMPRRDPAAFRLRKLWIDEHNFATRQALIQGNFTAGPSPSLPWIVHFFVAGDVMYIQDEQTMKPLTYLGRTYSNVTVAFANIQPVPQMGLSWSLAMFRTSGDVLREPAL